MIKNNLSVYESGTYLNMSYNTTTAAMQSPKQEIYIIDLNKLKGLHIENNAMNPVTTTANDDIVTKTSVVIGTNIW